MSALLGGGLPGAAGLRPGLRIAKALDVAPPDQVLAAGTNRLQVAVLDPATDRHVAHPELGGGGLNGQQVVLFHAADATAFCEQDNTLRAYTGSHENLYNSFTDYLPGGTVEDDDGVQIPLRARDGSIRAYAIVDAADADWVNQWRWSLLNHGSYARRRETVDGRQKTILLHRELLGLPRVKDGRRGDHIDRDTLNDRRSNLRVVTHTGNMQNVPSNAGSSSQYRGVCWDKSRGKWMAKRKANGQAVNLGRFTDELEAAEIVRQARARLMPFAVD
jgi:hypothetical protein